MRTAGAVLKKTPVLRVPASWHSLSCVKSAVLLPVSMAVRIVLFHQCPVQKPSKMILTYVETLLPPWWTKLPTAVRSGETHSDKDCAIAPLNLQNPLSFFLDLLLG